MQAAEQKGSPNRIYETPHWINGKPFVDEGTQRFGEIENSATGETIGRVPFANSDTIGRAVDAARNAFITWSETPAGKRVQILQAYKSLLIDHMDEILDLVVAEHGKTREDAAGAMARAIETLDMSCSAPLILKGEYTDQAASGLDVYSIRQPVGICAGITPFNFPEMIPLFMFVVAIAAGNTFILKPSEQDPSTAIRLAELFTEAGLPDGVLNVVQGDKEAVDAILEHPAIQAVSFIGSTSVARYVYEQCAKHGKRVQSFGGAKNHMVVLPDADLDQAADALVSAGYGSAGQRCMAITTAVAVGDVGDALIEKTRDRIANLVVSAGSTEGAHMGPLINRNAQERILEIINRGVDAGAELVVDGRSITVSGYEDGYFVGPTLFDRVTPEMELYREEIFGPVLIVVRARDFDEALELVKTNPYGNGAALFTQSGWAARRFQREATAGTIGINVPIPFPISVYGFGGWNQSAFGDRNINRDAFEFYTKPKVVSCRWPDAPSGVDMGFISES